LHQQAVNNWQEEREKLQSDLQNRERELANLKQVFDNVMNAHAPLEEVQKWKEKAEKLQLQVDQANRARREMQSAVGHMTHAASLQGGDLHSLQLHNQTLMQEKEKHAQGLKMAELEKKDLQVQIENLQSSCNYFQNKYKGTASELRQEQRQSAKNAEALAQAEVKLSQLQTEVQAWRSRHHAGHSSGNKVSPAVAVGASASPAPAASSREKESAYPGSLRHQPEAGRASLLSQLNMSQQFKS